MTIQLYNNRGQHDFDPGCSSITCNLVFTPYIFDSFRMNSQVDTIFTDYYKAFDRVNNNTLAEMLIYLALMNHFFHG